MLIMSTIGTTLLMLRTDSALANNFSYLGRCGMYQYGGEYASVILCGRSLANGIRKDPNNSVLRFEVFLPCYYPICRTGSWYQSAHAQGLSLIEFYQPTISLRIPKVLAVTANKATIAVYRSRIAKSYARKTKVVASLFYPRNKRYNKG